MIKLSDIERGIPLKELEERLKPAKHSSNSEWEDKSYEGFLGPNESLMDLIQEDYKTLKKFGVSYDQIAQKIKELEKSNENTINGHYFVIREYCCGAQSCPWDDGNRDGDFYMIVGDKENQEHIAFVEKWKTAGGILPSKEAFDKLFTKEPVLIISGLQYHLIKEHKFFQGKGTVYRSNPELIIKYLGVKK